MPNFPHPNKPGVYLRAFDDVDGIRENTFNEVKKAVVERFPLENERYRLDLEEVDYDKPKKYSLQEQKQALLDRRNLDWPLYGTWHLKDKASGATVSKARKIVARVPYITDRGTWIHNGNDYLFSNQARLRPGIYARKKDNGELESHVNLLPGTGRGFRMFMEPETGRFRFQLGQGFIPAYPVLSALGVSDSQMKEAWGDAIASANFTDRDFNLDRVYAKFADTKTRTQHPDPRAGIRSIFSMAEVDPEVSERNLGKPYKKLDGPSMLRALQKLLHIQQGKEEADDRDSQANQVTLGPEDFFAERIRKDPGGLGRALLWKVTNKGLVDGVPSNYFGKQIAGALLNSGLANAAVEVNPIEVRDGMFRITRMGVGGISSESAIPAECFTPDTEVFTDRGWVRWPDVKDDTVFACNVAGRLEFHRAHKLIVQDYSGLLYGIKTRTIDHLVTPNHRVWCQRSDGDQWGFEYAHHVHKGSIKLWSSPQAESCKEPRQLSGEVRIEELDHEDCYYTQEYSGKIYCAQVPGELLLVRRNGSVPIWSGNSRNVHPSQLGIIDPVRTAESTKIGVDVRAAEGVLKGSDGLLYREVLDKGGKKALVSARDLVHATVAFPGEKRESKWVRGIRNGKIDYLNPKEVDYWIPSPNSMFSMTSNMTPALSSIKGGRLLMVGKFFTQALPLKDPETPLVQSGREDGRSYEETMGEVLGTRSAPTDGQVLSVSPTSIDYIGKDGKRGSVELYHNQPFNQKVFLHNTPVVKPGDTFRKGDLLAHSNFTDKRGHYANGTNLRVAYIPWEGNYEDGIVISESAARKLSSEHMHPIKWMKGDDDTVSKNEFISIYPGKYNKEQISRIGSDGVVKQGQTVFPGDPLILAWAKNTPKGDRALLKGGRSWSSDKSVTWDRSDPGIVTDVSTRGGDIKITVKSFAPMTRGDKITNRAAAKGVIASPVPDHLMPHGPDGKPYEVLLNPLGIISRTNVAVLAETALAKIARKTGKPYVLPTFRDDDLVEYSLNELKKHGIPETETLTDPKTGRKIPNIFTGEQYFLKLHHMADDKWSARDTGSYTMDDAPAPGSVGQSKRMSGLEVAALISHGATGILRDKLVRGQRSDAYWQALRMGVQPKIPTESVAYSKFLNLIKAAGVSVRDHQTGIQVLPMTRKDVKETVGDRFHTSGDAIQLHGEKVVPGGLFDVSLTGGHQGNRWTGVRLHSPVPNPALEVPLQNLLGLTGPAYRELLGTEDGIRKVTDSLRRISVPKAIEENLQVLKSGKTSARDRALKNLRTLRTMEKEGFTPEDLLLDTIPVLPPKFRPVARVNGMELTSDANLLYKDMWEANENLKAAKEAGIAGPDEHLALYDSVKAVFGLGDSINPKNREKNVGGMLVHVFGKSSPKFSFFQRKLLSHTVDSVSRGVITPDQNLDMDSVGIPEDMAWNMYRPYIMRRLARKYNLGASSKVPLTELAQWVINRDDRAKREMEAEMSERPILYSRAPVWHKYGIIGAWPKLVPGNTIRLSPLNTPGLGADFDGNCTDFDEKIFLRMSQSVLDSMCDMSYTVFMSSDGATQLQGSDMRTVFDSQLMTRQDQSVISIGIGMFPHGDILGQDKNGADIYEVADGVEVLTFDQASCEAVWRKVTSFTHEKNVQTVQVRAGSHRVIVSDNESLAIFDPATGGILKMKPADVIGRYVPVASNPRLPFGTFGDRDLGWWVGAFLSDGWISGNTLGFAKLEQSKRDRFISLTRTHVHDNFLAKTHAQAGTGDSYKYGNSAKVHMNGADLVQAVSEFDLYEPASASSDRSALRKRIPAALLAEASEEFLWGILSGLLDGDGSLSKNMVTGKPRFGARFNTSSPSLRRSVEELLYRLGLSFSTTVSPPRGQSKEAYIICISTLDLWDKLGKLSVVGAREKELISEWMTYKPTDAGNNDPIPLTTDEAHALIEITRKPDPTTYSTLRKYLSNPRLSRNKLKDLIATYGLKEAEFKSLFARVNNENICWCSVDSVEDAGKRDVFDIAVEGTKTFFVNNGLLIYDTMNIHIPATEEAVRDIKEKMLPSKMLKSPADFRLAYAPRQEFLLGLWAATRASKEEPRTFATRKDALSAFLSGKIRINTPVRVLEEGSR